MIKLIIFIVAVILVIVFEFIWRRKHRLDISKAEVIGALIFERKKQAFTEFVNLYKTNRHNFKMIYADEFSGINIDKMTLVDFFILFGIGVDDVLVIDWRGEENDGEILEWCEQKAGKRIPWNEVSTLRRRYKKIEVEDLLKAINKDLNQDDLNLVTLKTTNDAYELLILSSQNLMELESIEKNLIARYN